MMPEDLKSLSSEEVADKLFGDLASSKEWWSLQKLEETKYVLWDKRLGIELRVTPGFLVALHEVSSYKHASEFAEKNRMRLVQDRGLLIRGTSEIAIKCNGVPPILTPGKEKFHIQFANGIEATIAHASMLFQRLVAIPSAETNTGLPDPAALTTLVVRNVDLDVATDMAELCLYVLRDWFPEAKFEFAALSAINVLGENLEDTSDEIEIIHSDFSTAYPWAIAFYNRALESEPLAGFLYYYRVLEACFDLVISDKVKKWKNDSSTDLAALFREVRSLARMEDTFALRQVLGQIVDQPLLDEALSNGVLAHASVDDLTSKIYSRRNEIAHGRRGQHQQVLVPYSFALNFSGEKDIYWHSLVGRLAKEAIEKWLRG